MFHRATSQFKVLRALGASCLHLFFRIQTFLTSSSSSLPWLYLFFRILTFLLLHLLPYPDYTSFSEFWFFVCFTSSSFSSYPLPPTDYTSFPEFCLLFLLLNFISPPPPPPAPPILPSGKWHKLFFLFFSHNFFHVKKMQCWTCGHWCCQNLCKVSIDISQ